MLDGEIGGFALNSALQLPSLWQVGLGGKQVRDAVDLHRRRLVWGNSTL
jgi:hypothetical protein